MKKWLWLLGLVGLLGCEGEPTVMVDKETPSDSDNKPQPQPTDEAPDAGEENIDFNDVWSDLISDGGPLESFYEDGGVLSCLPEEWPEVDSPISAILDFASLKLYSGSSEEGVVCDGTVCVPGTPCCVFCGLGFCGEPGTDGGMGSCPFATRSIGCDDNGDCREGFGGDTCCMTFNGTDCRAEENCSFSFDFSGADGGGFGGFSGGDGGILTMDGGHTNEDAGGESLDVDAGIPLLADAGAFEANDAGLPDQPQENLDAGVVSHATDAGDAAMTDAGVPPDILDGGMSYVDSGIIDENPEELGFWDTQGFPVCTRTLNCDVFGGEVCCTSERFTAVDIGVCLPIWLCLGSSFVDGFGDD